MAGLPECRSLLTVLAENLAESRAYCKILTKPTRLSALPFPFIPSPASFLLISLSLHCAALPFTPLRFALLRSPIRRVESSRVDPIQFNSAKLNSSHLVVSIQADSVTRRFISLRCRKSAATLHFSGGHVPRAPSTSGAPLFKTRLLATCTNHHHHHSSLRGGGGQISRPPKCERRKTISGRTELN